MHWRDRVSSGASWTFEFQSRIYCHVGGVEGVPKTQDRFDLGFNGYRGYEVRRRGRGKSHGLLLASVQSREIE